MSFFLAVDLDAPVRAAVAALIDRERTHLEARWLRPEKLHATLVFLGEPSADLLDHLQAQVAEVVTRHGPFSLRLKGAGTFVTARAPSVLWLGLDGELDHLHALQHDLSSVLKADEGRDYAPHVTLARSKADRAFDEVSRRLSGWEAGPFPVTDVVLYESTHVQYAPLFSCRLLASR